jgi:hypothetical protein
VSFDQFESPLKHKEVKPHLHRAQLYMPAERILGDVSLVLKIEIKNLSNFGAGLGNRTRAAGLGI